MMRAISSMLRERKARVDRHRKALKEFNRKYPDRKPVSWSLKEHSIPSGEDHSDRLFWAHQATQSLMVDISSRFRFACGAASRGGIGSYRHSTLALIPEMNPVDFDGVSILLLDRPIGDSDCRVVIAGRGQFDGETYSIVSESGESIVLDDATLNAVEMPLTGYWKKKYPASDWYIVTKPQTGAHTSRG